MSNLLGKTVGVHSASDFLKLDNDFSFYDDGIKVDTVFFDSSTDKSRSKKLLTWVFGWLMERRAKNWVKNYVIKNRDCLPGYENFLKNINSSGRVRRSEFMNLLAEARINRSPIFLQEQKNTVGLHSNFLIDNPNESLVSYLSKLRSPSLSEDSVKIFFNFIDRGNDSLSAENIETAVEFLDGFRAWCQQENELNSLEFLKGRVNLFAAAVEEKIAYLSGLNAFILHQKLLQIKKQKNTKEEKIRGREKSNKATKNNEIPKNHILKNIGTSVSNLQKILSSDSGTPLLRDAQKFIEKVDLSDALDSAFFAVKDFNIHHSLVLDILKSSEMDRVFFIYFLDYIQSGSLVINARNCDQLRLSAKEMIEPFLEGLREKIDDPLYDCLRLVFDKFIKDVDCFASENYARPVVLPGYLRDKKIK